MATATLALRFLAPAAALVVAGCGAVGEEDAGTRAYVERHLDAWMGARDSSTSSSASALRTARRCWPTGSAC